MLVVMAYCSRRIQIKISNIKGPQDRVQDRPGTSFLGPFPEESR